MHTAAMFAIMAMLGTAGGSAYLGLGSGTGPGDCGAPFFGDHDGDGIPNYEDEDWVPPHLRDDDGDGILNGEDPDWPPNQRDADGDGIPNNEDEDFVPPYLLDDDGDGVPNGEDPDWRPPFLGDGDGFRHRHRLCGCTANGTA